VLPSYDVTNQRAEYRLIAYHINYHNPARYRAAGTSGITLCQLCAGRDRDLYITCTIVHVTKLSSPSERLQCTQCVHVLVLTEGSGAVL
jgi:hypothetical protein